MSGPSWGNIGSLCGTFWALLGRSWQFWNPCRGLYWDPCGGPVGLSGARPGRSEQNVELPSGLGVGRGHCGRIPRVTLRHLLAVRPQSMGAAVSGLSGRSYCLSPTQS